MTTWAKGWMTREDSFECVLTSAHFVFTVRVVVTALHCVLG